jgi:hypothetical protein
MAGDDRYPPFMTDRSPSVERARREYEHPSPTGDPSLVAALAEVSEAEQNAVQAFSAVAARLSDPSLADQVRAEAEAHAAHRDALGEQITALGGSPPRPDECRDILTRGLEAVDAAGTDAAAMQALATMRAELRALYDRAMAQPAVDEAERAALARLQPH